MNLKNINNYPSIEKVLEELTAMVVNRSIEVNVKNNDPMPKVFYIGIGKTGSSSIKKFCLVFGVWCLVFGVWCLVFGKWFFCTSKPAYQQANKLLYAIVSTYTAQCLLKTATANCLTDHPSILVRPIQAIHLIERPWCTIILDIAHHII